MILGERLKKYIKETGGKIAVFERSIGVARGYLYTKSALGSDILIKIKEKYPDINLNWLLTGTGKMQNDTENLTQFTANNKNGNQNINGTQINYNQTREIELLKQQLSDKTKIIELLENHIKALTEK